MTQAQLIQQTLHTLAYLGVREVCVAYRAAVAAWQAVVDAHRAELSATAHGIPTPAGAWP